MGRSCFRRAGSQKGADGRGLSIGFSKVVHQTSPRPRGGGKSVGNRQAKPVVKPVDSPRSMRSPVPAAAGFLFLLLFLFRRFSTKIDAAKSPRHSRPWGAGAGAPAGELPAGSRGGAPLELVEALAR